MNLGSSNAAKMGDKLWRMFVLNAISANNEQTSPQKDVTQETH